MEQDADCEDSKRLRRLGGLQSLREEENDVIRKFFVKKKTINYSSTEETESLADVGHRS